MDGALARLRHKPGDFARDFALRVHEQTRPTISWALRLTVSAVAAFVATKLIFPGSTPLLAPMTTLIVMQLTLYNIVRSSLDRILSVLLGVAVAALFSHFVGITWWSLGLTIGVSVVAGQLLRLGANLVEVPITAMLVLSVSTATEQAATNRLIETLIGAAVGVLINIVVPPGVRTSNAGAAVERFGDEIAGLMERTAGQLLEGATRDQVSGWLTAARRLSVRTPDVDRALAHAEESRVLNVRALGTVDPTRALRSALDALEHCAVSTRSIFRGINDAVFFPDDDEDDDVYPYDARELTSEVLMALGGSIRAFAQLAHAQVRGPGTEEETTLIEALKHLAEVRQNARDQLKREHEVNQAVHELNVFLVATVGRVLRELDLRGHTWVGERTVEGNAERLRALQTAARMRSASRWFATRPRARSND